jgi:predicted dehydrogenase
MTRTAMINLGIVGAAGRGGHFRASCQASGALAIHAVCDRNEAVLEEARTRVGAREAWADYDEMLKRSEVQAVILGTPMPLHVPQAIAALERGIHVLSEVPAGVSIEECRRLVDAAKRSRAVYMMAENYTYMRSNGIVRELVKAGLFGETYFAEGEYLHELKELNETTPWRRTWQTGVDGITYGTHSLGPILQWMPGDRVVEVMCAGSGRHHRDPRGAQYENQASCVMLGRMAKGGLVKIRVDMLSDRPHAMTNYQLQGTDGCYESSRAWGDPDRIWLRSRSTSQGWTGLEDLAAEFLPERWRLHGDAAAKAGHGGGDFFEILDFADAIQGLRPAPIGIHEAMDMTLPGLVSQASIARNGAWLPVPDSRIW